MTDVVRRYLSERLEDVTLAMTTRELLAAARGAPTVSFDQLEELLEAVDPIKFAAAALTADRARALGATAQGIVRDEHDRAEAAPAGAGPPGGAARSTTGPPSLRHPGGWLCFFRFPWCWSF